jgi:hypothetical protein
MEAHEAHEAIHEAAHGQEHGGHAPSQGGTRNKRIAVLISMLAALLAVVEIGGKSAQNTSLSANIEAANLWSFFQAKTIRMTTLRTAAEAFDTLPPDEATSRRIAEWRAAAQRYDTEPDTGEGRSELAARAKAAEARRDHALAAYHMFEFGAAAMQIGIVLASAAVVTGVTALVLGAGGLGLVGIAFALLGWLAPTLVHL